MTTTPFPDLITHDITLPGAELVELRSADQPVRTVLGRVIARDLPCSRISGDGRRGCGAPTTMMLVRMPVRGLNLPGEHIVGLLEHCVECGHSMPGLVTATTQEIEDGWATGTVT